MRSGRESRWQRVGSAWRSGLWYLGLYCGGMAVGSSAGRATLDLLIWISGWRGLAQGWITWPVGFCTGYCCAQLALGWGRRRGLRSGLESTIQYWIVEDDDDGDGDGDGGDGDDQAEEG